MEKKSFLAQDILNLATLGQVKISPNGQNIVFEVKKTLLDTDETISDLWWYREGIDEQAEQLTFCGKASSPSWRDDQSLVFISSRSGKTQLYLVQLNGGEARQIKTESQPSSNLKWSLDGRYLAFMVAKTIELTSARYQGEPEELWKRHAENLTKVSEGKNETLKTAPVRVVTEFDYQADGRGFIYESYAQIFCYDFVEEKLIQLSAAQERIMDFCWNGSNEIIYIVEDFQEAAFLKHVNFFKQSLCLETREKKLHFPGQAGGLHYLGDIGFLFEGTRASVPMGTAPREIWLWDGGGEPISLTVEHDRNCRSIDWSDAHEAVFYLKENQGRNSLHKIALNSLAISAEETIDLDIGGGSIDSLAVSRKSKTVVFTYSDVDLLPQVYLKQGKTVKQISFLNSAYTDQGFFQSAEEISYTGPDNWPMQGWIIKPENYVTGQPVATIVSVHGGPTSSYLRSFNPMFQMLANQGFAVLYVNPRGSTGYGVQFTQGVIADWGGKDFADIMAGVDKVIELGIADPERLGLTGWSYGGYMTCWSITQTNRFKAAIGGANISSIYNLYGNSDIGAAYDEALMGGPAFDLEELYMNRSAIRHVRNVTTPVLLLHGEADRRCPIDQTEMYYAALKRLGKEAVFVRYPGQYHGLIKPSYIYDRWLRTDAWFKHYLNA